jgi:hypothetical protein
VLKRLTFGVSYAILPIVCLFAHFELVTVRPHQALGYLRPLKGLQQPEISKGKEGESLGY